MFLFKQFFYRLQLIFHLLYLFFLQVVESINLLFQVKYSPSEVLIFPGHLVDSLILLEKELLVSFCDLMKFGILYLQLVVQFFFVEELCLHLLDLI